MKHRLGTLFLATLLLLPAAMASAESEPESLAELRAACQRYAVEEGIKHDEMEEYLERCVLELQEPAQLPMDTEQGEEPKEPESH